MNDIVELNAIFNLLTEFTLAVSGESFHNNSAIDINRIGEFFSAEGALVCHTDDTTCCRGIDNPPNGVGQGTWYYPDGTAVPAPSDDLAPFYRSRGHMSLSLNRRLQSSRSGVYRCEVPAADRSMLIRYIGMYNGGKLSHC